MGPSQISNAGIAFFSSLCASTFALGCWQTQRYFEKVDLIAKRETALSLEPILYKIDHDRKREGPPSFRRLKLEGMFLHEHELFVGPRGPPLGAISSTGPSSGRGGGLSSSPQGYFVLTPFQVSLEHGKIDTILINRGWVPRHFIASTSNQNENQEIQMLDRPLGIVNIVGVESQVEGTFRIITC